MHTQEQVQNLKKGDPIVIKTKVHHVGSNGDIWFYAPACNSALRLDFISPDYVCPAYVSLPSDSQSSTVNSQSKYDPTRLFKKGDRIRFKTWHGFQPEDWENEAELLGKEATVYEDQKPDDFSVHFLFDGEDPDEEWHATYLPFIELVTPVEELEPYIVVDAHTHWDVADKNMKTVAMYSKGNHPHAKEAAEAECARLNAEWRKEHAHD